MEKRCQREEYVVSIDLEKGRVRFCFIVGLLFFLQSCNRAEDRQNQILEDGITQIDLAAGEDVAELDVSTIYGNGMKLVALKADGGFVIGDIDKVVLYDDRIYVLDKSIAETLFIYDSDGNPLERITIGKGGDELTSIGDFCVDDGVLFVLDERSNRVGRYDLDGATRLGSTVSLPNNISNIAAIGGHLLCYRALVDNFDGGMASSTLFLLDQEGNVKKHWLPVSESNFYLTQYIGDKSVMRKLNNRVYISRLMDDAFYMYSAESGQLSQRFKVDFGEKGIPDNLKTGHTDLEFVDNLHKGAYHYSLSGYVETNKFVCFNISRGRAVNSVLM